MENKGKLILIDKETLIRGRSKRAVVPYIYIYIRDRKKVVHTVSGMGRTS